MPQQEFLKPKLIGDRFNGPAVPLELLKDFAVLQEMLVEVAKWKFKQEHPGRERVQRNFSKDIELQLVGVEEGSAILAIALTFTSNTLFQPANVTYYEQAKTAIVESIADSAEGRSPQLPPNLLSYFDRFGRSLRSGESIEFPRQQGTATFNTEVRKQLIRASKAETWTEEAALRARVHEANQAQDTFEFELSDGFKAKAPMDDKHRDAILEAFNAYRSGAYYLIQGIVQRDRSDRIKGFESIEHITPLDPLDTALRLEQIAQLKDGWLDGKGTAPTKDKLDWLNAAFEAGFSPELPLPYLYPTAEGGIQAEWSLHDWSVTLEINLETQIGEYQALNLKDQTSTDLQFHLGEPGGWEQLNQALKQIDAQTVEAS
jgi:hypothetical protein